MSRNNDGLPMLPPWLSESEVSDNRGYEAPVQNLPHEEYIPEEPQRRLFNRKRRKDKAEPESPPRAEAAAPQADPRPWGAESLPAEGDPRRDPAQGGYTPDRPPLPRRSGGEFQLPHRQPQPAPAPQAYTQPPAPQAPDVSATETTTRVPPRPERPDLPPPPPPPPNRPPLPEPPSPSNRPAPAVPDSLPPHPDSAQSSVPQQNGPAPTAARESAPAPDLPRPSEQPWLAAPRAPESSVPERPTAETRPAPDRAPESAVPPADPRYSQSGTQYGHQGVQPTPSPHPAPDAPRTGADHPNQAAPQVGFPTPQQHRAPEATQHFAADQPKQAAPQVGSPTPPQRQPSKAPQNFDADQANQAAPQVGFPPANQAPEAPQKHGADQANQAAPQASSPTPQQHRAPEAPQNYGAEQANQAASQVGSPTPQRHQTSKAPQEHGAEQANQAEPHGGFSPAPTQHQAPEATQHFGADQANQAAPQVGFSTPQQQYGQPPGPQSEASPVQGHWQSPPAPQWGLPPQQPYLPPQHQQYPPHFHQQPPGPPPSLDDVPVRRAKKSPGSGWRRAVHHMSGGAINPGMSAEERRLQELVARIRQPVRGDYRIAVLSLKGGVGKTTTTMGIGSIFASIRGDRVIAVDANPDFGTLSQRVPLQTRSTVRDLLLDSAINSYGDVRRHTSQATSRLEVLASERDPAASEAFSEDEYRQVARILQRYYNIILTDCGTGLMHSAMSGVLDLAHSLVLISSSAIDGARSAAATLDWLSLHGHDHLVRNAVVVINLPRPGSPNVGIQQLREYFLSRCRAVHIIPYDPHLSEGAEIDLARLHKNTKRALVELAATVADDFAVDHHRGRPL
ncbi:MinD/ParA family ATP-binding protein [Nocardia terpenica]|uniref:MinD/ParA family ATP-binding protein n=1 Tax=Nocardia terpenica TaxID=455432 RepID=UPI001EE9F2ED|nr:MinD/ParA family protein [Nocardia terpenica]